jgi:hypothetical protein
MKRKDSENSERNQTLPWYRKKGYRGKMSEKEKRLLDRWRMQERHPAVAYDELPLEVQGYLSRLEGEVYDNKQATLVFGVLALSVIGAYQLYQWYKVGEPSSLVFGLAMSFVPWIYYRIKWKKNSADFLPIDNPTRSADEAMQEEWDLNHLSEMRSAEKSTHSQEN